MTPTLGPKVCRSYLRAGPVASMEFGLYVDVGGTWRDHNSEKDTSGNFPKLRVPFWGSL